MFNILRNRQTVLHSGSTISHSHQQGRRVLVSPSLHQPLALPKPHFRGEETEHSVGKVSRMAREQRSRIHTPV